MKYIPYKLKRRNFIAATGGALGLIALLRNMESRAQGVGVPRRLMVTHHPVGSIRPVWLPTGDRTNFTLSSVLAPFEPFKADMIVLDSLDLNMTGGGGGHEKGTVVMMTGSPTRSQRSGQSETDDPYATGPSLDQLLLAKSTELSSTPFQSLQALCDDRIDAQEISTRTLSYSMATQAVNTVAGSDVENIPVRPTLRPLDLYTRVFGTMMPNGNTPGNQDALTASLAARKSALDFSVRELARLRTLAPASQRELLDAHENAILELEAELGAMVSAECILPEPPADISGGMDDGEFIGPMDYANPTATVADDELHRQVGEAHLLILKAAMQCDLTRVITFQWSPGTNHVSFQGQHPSGPNAIYMHHPTSHRVGGADLDPNGSATQSRSEDAVFLNNVETWYNQRLADFLVTMRDTPDVLAGDGSSLLDNTIIPYLTEVSRATHQWDPVGVCLFGGKNLGFQGGQFFNALRRPHNDMWLTLAAALGVTEDQLQGEAFMDGPREGVITELLG